MNDLFLLVDHTDDWKPYCETDSLLTVSDYLEHKYDGKPQLVVNLSRDYAYNSSGYYASLLAQARGHKILPGVETLNRLEAGQGVRMSMELQRLCFQWIARNDIDEGECWHLNIFLGTCAEKGLERIARFIFENYPAPLLRVSFNTGRRNQIESVRALSLGELTDSEQDTFAAALDNFSKRVWRTRSVKPARYSMAILYDPDEEFPPSDKQALRRFMEVAKRMGVHTELITEEDGPRLLEFDALFIRTTTSLNHYTYRFAQRARQNGLVVIDDPLSIIRCTNKVYLCELFRKARIPTPESLLLFGSERYSFEEIAARLGAPFILKIPDGSFSVGMHKVADRDELRTALDEMFGHSSVVLAQEFTPTEFDWRIGILDGEPLFACKYFMAKGHWQIYNHAVTGKNLCGPWETIPVYKVPAKVRETALKAAALIGKGLYGVDLKVVDGRPVVIEINDNPSIDHEVEDEVLGDELYYRIVNYFINKLSRMHV